MIYQFDELIFRYNKYAIAIIWLVLPLVNNNTTSHIFIILINLIQNRHKSPLMISYIKKQ